MKKLLVTAAILAGLAVAAAPVAYACKQWSCTTNIFGQTCTCTWP